MPTAAKLVAAFAFAMLGFATCLVLREVMPESLRVGRMFEAAVLCGALSGWMISGRARRGWPWPIVWSAVLTAHRSR